MSTSRNETALQEAFCITRGVLQTIRLGSEIARSLKPGDVVALTGELGAGKTYFIKGIAKGLSIPEREVTSPTYKFLNRYTGKFILNHIDAYRLSSSAEASDTLGDEITDKKAITVIEWADRISDLIPKNALSVKIEIISMRTRQFIFSGSARLHRIHKILKQFSRATGVPKPRRLSAG
jgi:tRNA threonylcarbamoyladenosine biosynthesis protein TsaE